MIKHEKRVKNNLLSVINKMDENHKKFVVDSTKHFTRKGKLEFSELIRLIISMGGNSLNKEILSYFNYDPQACSKSAFVQKRGKLNDYAFEYLLKEFVKTFEKPTTHKGYRLFAVDGSTLNISFDSNDPLTYVLHKNNQKGYNSLHLNGLFDLCNKLYYDIVIQKGKNMNEYRALMDMVDRSEISDKTILIADRGYESYNVFAHINEKNWNYLIRGKDITSNGIAKALPLPDTDEFDETISMTLTRKKAKELLDEGKLYRFINKTVAFDYFNDDNNSYDISFRVVRIKISEDNYETLFTNLDKSEFPANKIKDLYHTRWGIETSYRELKHIIGLTAFHSKKVAFNIQEIYARLVLYNFCEMILNPIIIKKMDTKLTYQLNFTIAFNICIEFFRNRNNKRRIDVGKLISRYLEPIRPDRHYPRNIKRGSTVSFLYRVA